MTRPQLLGLLAEAVHLAGRPGEALHLLDEALAQVDQDDGRAFEAELHRLRGESLLAVSPSLAGKAEAALRASIEVASRQGATLLERRATLDLHHLRTGRPAQSSR